MDCHLPSCKNSAIDHGGRDDIIRGVQTVVTDLVKKGADLASSLEKLSLIVVEDFCQSLDAPELPDLDLIISSGGEKRISNFLLWKSAYAGLHFSDTLWPDVTEKGRNHPSLVFLILKHGMKIRAHRMQPK